jgi:hypothetical protein
MITETITWHEIVEGPPDADTTVQIALDETHNEPTSSGFFDGAAWFDVTGAPIEGVIGWADMPQGLRRG